MIEGFFFDGAPVEPSDRAQSAGDRRTSPASGLQVTGEVLDVGAADSEQAQVTLTAPAGELAQVECVGLTGQTCVPARNPAKPGVPGQ